MKKCILITGATSDIGIEYIKSLKCSDIKIIALYNTNSTVLDDLQDKYNLNIEKIQLDLCKIDNIKNIIEDINNKFNITHILHLASPKLKKERFNKIDINEYLENYNIQVLSLIEILKLVLPIMKKNRYGKIIFMLSSVTLNIPPKFNTPYVITKYALLGLMKSLVSEYSEFNIQINSISPSMIETKFLDNIDNRLVEINATNHPLKRNLKASEIVQHINYLYNNSNFINGINLNISGGEQY